LIPILAGLGRDMAAWIRTGSPSGLRSAAPSRTADVYRGKIFTYRLHRSDMISLIGHSLSYWPQESLVRITRQTTA
jgi:hypothetical protein